MLKHVRLGALAVGLGLGVLSSGGAAAERAEPVTGPAPALTYVTLNVLHGGVLSGLTGRDQDLERRLEIVAEELAALRPDIVGLQEASTSRRRGNVAERLAARLGFEFAYAPALFRFSRAEWNNRVEAMRRALHLGAT